MRNLYLLEGRGDKTQHAPFPQQTPLLVAGRQLAVRLLRGLASNDEAALRALGSKLLTEMI